jgi:hypothetical protein
MNKKETIYNLLDVLIDTEKIRDLKDKKEHPKLVGESAMLYHLKRLKELIREEMGT